MRIRILSFSENREVCEKCVGDSIVHVNFVFYEALELIEQNYDRQSACENYWEQIIAVK